MNEITACGAMIGIEDEVNVFLSYQGSLPKNLFKQPNSLSLLSQSWRFKEGLLYYYIFKIGNVGIAED